MHRGVGPAPHTVLDHAAWAREAFALLGDLPGVARVGIALAEGGGRRLRFTASDREGAGLPWCHVDAYDDVPLNTVVRTGRLVVGSLEQLRDRYPAFVDRQRGTGHVALAAVPLVASGQVLGGYVLYLDRPQSFDAAQRAELARAGAELGEALRRSQRGRRRPGPQEDAVPVPRGAKVAVHEVPADPAAVGQARRFLRRTLEEWHVDEDTADTAVLCLSELVTNALLHAQTDSLVRAQLERDVLTVSVRDNGVSGAGAEQPPDDPLRVHGRGLQLVEALVSRWGSELDDVGTNVWFVLELP